MAASTPRHFVFTGHSGFIFLDHDGALHCLRQAIQVYFPAMHDIGTVAVGAKSSEFKSCHTGATWKSVKKFRLHPCNREHAAPTLHITSGGCRLQAQGSNSGAFQTASMTFTHDTVVLVLAYCVIVCAVLLH
jgi:hypothetical protein